VKRRSDVIVIGAGAAGLAAAEALSRGGASVVVLEARARAGGRIWTRRMRGWPLPIELGAEFVHGKNDDLFELARPAGLLIDRLPDVHFESAGSRWRRSSGVWKQFDAITRKMRRTGRDRSVAEFLRMYRALSGAQKRLATSLIQGYYAAELDRASEHALSTAGDPPPSADEQSQFRILSGYDGVTERLRSLIDPKQGRLLFSTPVRQIRWRRGDVTVRTADSGEFRARHAIVTVPAGVLKDPPDAKGAIRFDPDPPEMRRALDGIAVGHAVKIVLLFREAFWEEQTEEGEEIAFFHKWDAAFPTWWTAAPAQVPMLTGWASGPAAKALERLPRNVVLRRALEALESLFEVPVGKSRRLLIAWHAHDWTRDPFARGAYTYQAVGGANAPSALGRPIAGTLFFAGEATEREENGTVPGAITSGRRAARLIGVRSPLATSR
jgi:monoamine oxidase